MHSSHVVVRQRPHRAPDSSLTAFAHLFGILAFILILFWLLHYRGGIKYDSYDGYRVFNVRKEKLHMVSVIYYYYYYLIGYL